MNGHVLTFPIDLYVYDLGGKILSPNGDNLENVWYTTIVAFGREYAFSLAGIECCQPKATIHGEPKRVEHMGDTEIPYSIFFDFVLTLSENSYRPLSFDIRKHNSTKFCDDVLQFTLGVRIPKYLLEMPQDDLFTSSLEDLIQPLVKKVGAMASKNDSSTATSAGNSPFDLLSTSGGRNQHVLYGNHVPKGPRKNRDPSPDLIEIQAQIESIRADQKNLKERRSKQKSTSISPRETIERDLVGSANNHHHHHQEKPHHHHRSKKSSSVSPTQKRRHRRQKSPHPGASQKNKDQQHPLVQVIANSGHSSTVTAQQQQKKQQETVKNSHKTPSHNNPIKQKSKSRSSSREPSSSRSKSSLRKRVSFDDTPVEISRETSLSKISSNHSNNELVPNGIHLNHHHHQTFLNHHKSHGDDDEIEEDQLPELQEDDLFSTYESLKAHASISPSPPPLFWSDLSKDEKKVVSANKARSPMGSKVLNAKSSSKSPEIEVVKADSTKPDTATAIQKLITFQELDHMGDFEEFVRDVIDLISHEEQNRLYEMELWIMNGEGVWVLDDSLIAFVGRVLCDTKTFTTDIRVTLLRLLAYGAIQDDFSIILHMDRKDHFIMNYAKDFESIPILEQEALALFFANMFEACSDWLLYISEWRQGSTNLSNVKVTTKVAVSSLLGDTSSLQDYGSAMMHNFSSKDVKSVVFDDVYTELTMAILQFFQGKPSEEKVFRCMKALVKFCHLSKREVPQLVKMIGPEPSKFSGMSTRVDELIEKIYAHTSKIPF